jgi:hypothetical protein
VSDATGAVTTNYSFKTISGEDTAGYTSINAVITSIDTQLMDKAFKPDMIVLYQGASAPSGWQDVDAAVVSAGGPASGTGYIWIKKT